MCSSYSAAARNRIMVRLKQNVVGYQMVEAVLRGWPTRKPLPLWIPQGNLRKVGNVSDFALDQAGSHEVEYERIDITTDEGRKDKYSGGYGDDLDGTWDNVVKIVEESR